tara:strand:- start:162 stop:383 length:222 start_codon:yes stop_codon:yes gene_type:complete
MEPLTDIEKDITLNKWWISSEINRLLAWEILCSVARGKQEIPIRVMDLCDMIGTSEDFYSKILYTVRNKLNEK